MWHSVEKAIEEATASPYSISQKQTVTGGDINLSYKITDGNQPYFIKINDKSRQSNFDAEIYSLSQLSSQSNIKCPKVICSGSTLDKSFLVLEYLSLKAATNQQWKDLGKKLAEFHKNTVHGQFGWQDDNYIGLSIQPNHWASNWRVFFAEQRIAWQLQLLSEKSIIFGDIEHISQICHDELLHHHVEPCLLHGDLWQGNIGFADSGPVLFDPASYYGDREVDIAMTELFGQFPTAFYQGYHQAYPLPEKYEQRKTVYNFYHVLNHANMFGGIYIEQAKAMLHRILSSHNH